MKKTKNVVGVNQSEQWDITIDIEKSCDEVMEILNNAALRMNDQKLINFTQALTLRQLQEREGRYV